MRSNFVFQEIWVGLRRNLTMTVALIVVVAISLSLLGTGLLFVKQVDRTRTYWQSQVEISVYLCYKGDINPNCHGAMTPAAAAERSSSGLTAMPQVENVSLRVAATGVHAVQVGDVQRAVARLDRHRERAAALARGQAAEPVGRLPHRGERGPRGAGRRFGDRRDDHPQQVLPAARRPAERGHRGGADPRRRRGAAGGQHDQALRVQPAQRDRHHAARRRLQLLHSTAVPARGRDRRPVRLGDRGSAARRGEIAAAQQPAAVLQLQRRAVGRRTWSRSSCSR